jgi:hypothetical protein
VQVWSLFDFALGTEGFDVSESEESESDESELEPDSELESTLLQHKCTVDMERNTSS